MNDELWTKFLSRKLGMAGVAIGVIATLPSPDPLTIALKIGGIAAVAVGYLTANALNKGAPSE
jgi:uncharacterized membrane protein